MLKAISPVDGRYSNKTSELVDFFSEYALIKYRVQVEVNYFIALLPLKLKALEDFPASKVEILRKISNEFSEDDAALIKEIETKTNHDVKAVEYFLKDKFKEHKLEKYAEFIHFGLTSQDINNTAIPISIREALHTVYIPLVHALKEQLQELSAQWRHIPMLARTHGQPASPTLLGKELFVFIDRLQMQLFRANQLACACKIWRGSWQF